MKKIVILTALAFALAPVAAFAAPSPAQQASKDCAALRAKIGVTAFTQAFGSASNAFGRCVSKFARVERANVSSANSLCRAEQADLTFALSHGGKTFAQFYGKGKGKNAFGRCVSLKTQSSSTVEVGNLNPSQTCAALRTKFGPSLFAVSFGTNKSHRNAFGKCVSLAARSQSSFTVSAASACLGEVNDSGFAASHGGKTFAQFYGTNSDLSNAFGKCVASKVDAATAKLQESLSNAAKTCRNLRRNDPQGFHTTYGSHPNAFAKCVVANAHAK